uniref:Putative LRR receptor-like serine/threonine-protein kinase At1g56130 n=1 Tax=Rhizophora mucronata TaxID=61149 RepID=A0A2P2MWM5_RHIMU
MILLKLKSSCVKLWYSPILVGIVLVILLFLSIKIVKDFMFLTKSSEELPLYKSLILNCFKEVRLANSDGIGPTKELPVNRKSLSFDQFPMKAGIVPVSSLSEPQRVSMFCQLANVEGISPLNPQLSNRIRCKFVQFPSSEGRDPEKLFPPK